MNKILLGIIACLALTVVVQTWRLGQCQVKADRLNTCEEVSELEQEARDVSDDDLINSISQP